MESRGFVAIALKSTAEKTHPPNVSVHANLARTQEAIFFRSANSILLVLRCIQ
jgi:hypothetical protein